MISSIKFLLLSILVLQIQEFLQQGKGILPFCITTICTDLRRLKFSDGMGEEKTSAGSS